METVYIVVTEINEMVFSHAFSKFELADEFLSSSSKKGMTILNFQSTQIDKMVSQNNN